VGPPAEADDDHDGAEDDSRDPQPFEIAVWTRNVAISTGGDVDDDFPTIRHEF
jgi:hypothetical protein